MPYHFETARAGDQLRKESVSPAEVALDVAPPVVDAPARVDRTGVELKRGAFLNTIAMLASNFRGIFTFLVARMLGPAALGIFSVAWSTTDIISKIGVLGLDNAITTFIARSEAVGDRARSRALFRIAVVLGIVQSIITAGIVILALRFFNNRLHVQPQMVSALALVHCAVGPSYARLLCWTRARCDACNRRYLQCGHWHCQRPAEGQSNFQSHFRAGRSRHDRDGRSRRGCCYLRSTCSVDALDPVAAGSSDVVRR